MEIIMKIIKKWAKEHPRKTYLQNFFKKLPSAPKDACGYPRVCRNYVYGAHGCDPTKTCSDCWNETMDE